MSEQEWFSPKDKLPPDGKVVETLNSAGQMTQLKRQGNLWFFASGSMYVYYVPTFWREAEQKPGTGRRSTADAGENLADYLLRTPPPMWDYKYARELALKVATGQDAVEATWQAVELVGLDAFRTRLESLAQEWEEGAVETGYGVAAMERCARQLRALLALPAPAFDAWWNEASASWTATADETTKSVAKLAFAAGQAASAGQPALPDFTGNYENTGQPAASKTLSTTSAEFEHKHPSG